jgi:glycosyltransferase involved in cell wall biosynthesis
MAAIASLFDRMTLLVTRRDEPGEGGIPLPATADVVILRSPQGQDFRRKLYVLRHLSEYVSVIARHVRRADVVHVPPPGDLTLLGMILGLALRRRLLVRYCGSWVRTSRTTTMNRVTRGLMRIFAGGRNVMLATGESDRSPAPGIHWIFSTGLSAEELRRLAPRTENGLFAPPRIVYVGRLSPEKGVINLIEAVAALGRDGFSPLPTVEILGDGPEREALEKRVRDLGLAERIRFTGQLDRRALSERLARADLCVQPSFSEGYSKAWLDAFAHGLPVLGSEAGAGRHVIGEDGERGWLVPPGNLARLEEKLRLVLQEPRDWAALRRRCRAFAEGRTLEAWARQIGQRCASQWGVDLRDGKLAL